MTAHCGLARSSSENCIKRRKPCCNRTFKKRSKRTKSDKVFADSIKIPFSTPQVFYAFFQVAKGGQCRWTGQLKRS